MILERSHAGFGARDPRRAAGSGARTVSFAGEYLLQRPRVLPPPVRSWSAWPRWSVASLRDRARRTDPGAGSVAVGRGGRRAAIHEGPRGPPSAESAPSVVHGLYRLCCHMGQRGPLLICVDDADAMDDATVELLLYVSHRLDDPAAALLVAANVEAMPSEVAGLVRHPGATHIRLGPLSRFDNESWRAKPLSKAHDKFCTACHESTREPVILSELSQELQAQGMAGNAEEAAGVREWRRAGGRRGSAARARLGQGPWTGRAIARSEVDASFVMPPPRRDDPDEAALGRAVGRCAALRGGSTILHSGRSPLEDTRTRPQRESYGSRGVMADGAGLASRRADGRRATAAVERRYWSARRRPLWQWASQSARGNSECSGEPPDTSSAVSRARWAAPSNGWSPEALDGCEARRRLGSVRIEPWEPWRGASDRPGALPDGSELFCRGLAGSGNTTSRFVPSWRFVRQGGRLGYELPADSLDLGGGVRHSRVDCSRLPLRRRAGGPTGGGDEADGATGAWARNARRRARGRRDRARARRSHADAGGRSSVSRSGADRGDRAGSRTRVGGRLDDGS